jgi:ABC-type cobalamin/Fe3+-siderophores transport system ATPase subunit
MNASSRIANHDHAASAGRAALLAAQSIARRFGAFEALADTTLSIGVGEIVALVGANGCGKSTLLRALAGIADGSGAVLLDGRATTREAAARVRAFVPQRPEVAADFTAREVVELGRFARGFDPGAVDRALAAVGLSARAERPVRLLSGGERQRVAVARALAQIDGAERPLLLLDEPFSGIDPGEVARIVAALRALATRGAVVLSLHEPGLARAVATRALVMRGGRVIADGSARETLTAEILSEAYGHPMVESVGWLAPDLDGRG